MVSQISKTPAQLRKWMQQQLADGGIESADFESRILVEQVLDLPHGAPLPQTPLTPAQREKAETMVQRRLSHTPLQYLCGSWDFFGLTFAVGEGVLIPRPDTETLVETVLSLRRGAPKTHLLDLCSGTGCIPAATAQHLPSVTGAALEKHSAAIGYLAQNLRRHAPQLLCVQGDACDPPAQLLAEKYDVITCNPPYLTAQDMQRLQPEVAYEPETALFGGKDGLFFYVHLTPLWKPALKPGGWLVYEVGAGQAQDVAEILAQNGFQAVDVQKDLCGVARVVLGQR